MFQGLTQKSEVSEKDRPVLSIFGQHFRSRTLISGSVYDQKAFKKGSWKVSKLLFARL